MPRVKAIRDVALDVAYAVGTRAQEEGLASASEPEALRKKLAETQWFPEYVEYEAFGVWRSAFGVRRSGGNLVQEHGKWQVSRVEGAPTG